MSRIKDWINNLWVHIKHSPKEFIKSIPLAPIEVALLVITIVAIWNLWFIIAVVILYYIAIIKKGSLKNRIKDLESDIDKLIDDNESKLG